MQSKTECTLIIHNIRSAHNVGSMFRTADGAGVREIILSGYSPCPPKEGAMYYSDADKALKKTALGAEKTVPWRKTNSLSKTIAELKKSGFAVAALEQNEKSVSFGNFLSPQKMALIVGNEVRGVDKKILKLCDAIIEIPMRGKKNSLNVSVAAGVVLYQILK